MTRRTADDEARWAEAMSILEATPTESADQRLRRARRNRMLMVAGFVVLTLVVASVVVLLLLNGDGDDGGSDQGDDVPTWLVVLGFSLSVVGLVVMVVGIVLLLRTMRGHRGWRSALNLLTFRQRRELLAQLRGRTPLVPAQLPLVRAMADQLIASRVSLLPQAGLLLMFLGQWIGDRSAWRLAVVVAFGAVLLAAAVLGKRDADRARRFLVQHSGAETVRD